jgi:DNA/RNA endonuclease YhcR with UshA esterase domain
MRVVSVVLAAVAVAAFAVPAAAHHSFAAQYDANKPVTLKGTVTKVEWTNPHARIYLDVKDADGNVVNWDFELGPPNGLMRQGWRRDSLREGHVVTISGFLSKDQEHVANARSVNLPDGRQVLAGSSFDIDSATAAP